MTGEVASISLPRCGLVMAGVWLALFAVGLAVNRLEGGVTPGRAVRSAALTLGKELPKRKPRKRKAA